MENTKQLKPLLCRRKIKSFLSPKLLQTRQILINPATTRSSETDSEESQAAEGWWCFLEDLEQTVPSFAVISPTTLGAGLDTEGLEPRDSLPPPPPPPLTEETQPHHPPQQTFPLLSHQGEADTSPGPGVQVHSALPRCDTGAGDAPSRTTLTPTVAQRPKQARRAPRRDRGHGPRHTVLGGAEEEPREAFVVVEQHFSLRRRWEPLLR